MNTNTNNTYLAIFLGSKTGPKMAAWNALPEKEQQAKMQEGMAAWKAWVAKYQEAIVEMGGPLGKTKKITARGIEDVSNEMGAFTVVRADSHEAAAKMFENHPHFTNFPGESVEVMPVTASAQAGLKEDFESAVSQCEQTTLTPHNVNERVDCVNDVRTRMSQASNYPHPELISQINAANKAAAAAYSGNKISKEQFEAATLQNKATFEQNEQIARSNDQAQRGQALMNFGNVLTNYSQQQQANTNAQNQLLLNSMPRTTNCRQTPQGMNCTTW